MANVLSQEEIDALMGSLSSTQTSVDDRYRSNLRQDRGVSPPSWKRLTTVSRASCKRNCQRPCNHPLEVRISDRRTCGFWDFSRSLEKPSVLHILKLSSIKDKWTAGPSGAADPDADGPAFRWRRIADRASRGSRIYADRETRDGPDRGRDLPLLRRIMVVDATGQRPNRIHRDQRAVN